MLRALADRIRKKGFAGPHYDGLRGKLRFVAESTVARREIVFAATPASFAEAPKPRADELVLHPIRAFGDFAPFREGLEAAWYPGLVESFRAPLGWGEQAVVGTVGGRVACYNWMQVGTAEGFPTPYGRMFAGEARILRGAVAPDFRRGGLNTAMKHRILQAWFDAGMRIVHAECYANNLPSVRTLLRIGFRPAAMVTVLELPLLRGFLRWHPLPADPAALRRLGLDPAPRDVDRETGLSAAASVAAPA